jgi:hypothetical protein
LIPNWKGEEKWNDVVAELGSGSSREMCLRYDLLPMTGRRRKLRACRSRCHEAEERRRWSRAESGKWTDQVEEPDYLSTVAGGGNGEGRTYIQRFVAQARWGGGGDRHGIRAEER